MTRPNILWLCADQLRADALGSYGNPYVETPHLDRLAGEGVLFDHAYVQNPMCAPSRASFLTGRYPRTTRVRQNGQSIPPDERLLPRILADSGYTCGLVGKLHIGAAHPRPDRPVEERVDDGYSWFSWSHQPPPNANQAAMDWPNNAYTRWLRARGVTFAREQHPDFPQIQYGPAEDDQHTAWCADTATEFIDTMADYPQPWLLSVNFFAPHHPFDPPRELLERYLAIADELPLPDYRPGELEDKPDHQLAQHTASSNGRSLEFPEMSDAEHRAARAAYWAMVDMMDRQIGRILDGLERTGQRDNTIIAFHADHGEMLGDHGLYLKGAFLYDAAIRVPLILNWPAGLPADRHVQNGMVELVDLAPTLLELVGLDPEPGIQGRSLLPMINGDISDEDHRGDVYCESYNTSSGGQKVYATMLRTSDHKLVVVHPSPAGANQRAGGELYDLNLDPGEHVNRWDDPDHLPIKTQLLQRMCDRMAMTADPLPIRDDVW